jgi:hypothetical protein
MDEAGGRRRKAEDRRQNSGDRRQKTMNDFKDVCD